MSFDSTIAARLVKALGSDSMKTWKIVANTGKRADLECGAEKREVQRPEHISARDFIHWLVPDSRIDEGALNSLFKR